MAPDADIIFERLAVNPYQIAVLDLPTRPIKQTDSRAKRSGTVASVELDAIEPNLLRGIVEQALERHLPPAELAVLEAAEESERSILRDMICRLNGGSDLDY